MIPRRHVLVAVSAALLPAGAGAQEHPPTLPQRDVDVTYVIPTPAGAARQRLRVSALRQILRLDPPGDGLYIIIDLRAGRMVTVRTVDRSVIEMAAPRSWMPGLGHASYTRRNATTVSGVACTEWETTDSEGRKVQLCLDADGVMMRARMHTPAGEATLALATDVRRQTQDPAIFQEPAGYRRLAPPPIKRAQ